MEQRLTRGHDGERTSDLLMQAFEAIDFDQFGLRLRSGYTQRSQSQMLRNGEVRPIASGILALPVSGLELWWQQLAALVASSWPEVAVSRESAAALWGFDSFDVGSATGSVDAIRARSARTRNVHRPTRDIEWTTTPAIPFPVTTPTETILALAGTRFSDKRWLSAVDRLELAVESALRQGLVTCAGLAAAIEEAPRTLRGKVRLRSFLANRPPGLVPTESYLETRLVQVARARGVEDIPRQIEVFDGRGRIGRVDFLPEGVVVECDSEKWHNNPVAFKKDRERRSRLLAAGHPVIEATSDRVEFDADNLVRDIRAAIQLVKNARSGADFATKTPKIMAKSA
jgi:very-short-patch-repair endonuclease